MLSFLPAFMAAYVFVLVALLVGRFYVKRFDFGGPDAMRWSTIWIVISTAAFFAQHYVIFSLVVLIVCLKLVPREASDRVVYYAAILPVIPMFTYRIPGPPGIGYLFNLNYPRLLILFLLLPLALRWTNDRRPHRHERRAGSKADLFVILYTFWTCVVVLLHTESITEGVRRVLFDNLLFVALPYFVVSRALTDLENIRRAIVAIVFSGIIVTVIGAFEQYADWWFYQFVPDILKLNPLDWLAKISYSRGGFIRIKSSIEGGIGYFTVVSLGCLLFLATVSKLNRWFLIGSAALITSALFFTGARGAWLAAIVMIAIYWKFNYFNSPAKLFLLLIGGAASMQVIDMVLAWYQDNEGTFDYRRQLIEAATPLIFENFFFGVENLEATGRLEHLRQGEGIIDVVNTYLIVGLTSGGLNLLFYIGIFLTLLFETVAVRPTGTTEEQALSAALKRLLISLLLMTMVLIATVSPVGYLPSYNWLIFALAAAYGRLAKQSAPLAVGLPRPTKRQQRAIENLQKT